MMNLKRNTLFIYMMILTLALVFTGCQKPQEISMEKVEESDKNMLKEKRTITIGTSASYYPWAFQKDDTLQGYEIDVWKEIANRNGYNLDFKLAQFSGLVGMLDAGQINSIAHQMSITDERLEKYYFTEPYAYSFYDFAVKSDRTLKTLEDLKGKKVGCWLGGNGEKTIRNLNKKENLNLHIKTYDGAPIETEVELGRIDASWQGEIKTMSTIKEGNLNLKMLGIRPFYEINAYPFIKNDENKVLQQEISETIKEMREDGTLKELSEKWFGLDTTTKPEN